MTELAFKESPSEDEDEPDTHDGTPETEQPLHAENKNDEDAYEKMVSTTLAMPTIRLTPIPIFRCCWYAKH